MTPSNSSPLQIKGQRVVKKIDAFTIALKIPKGQSIEFKGMQKVEQLKLKPMFETPNKRQYSKHFETSLSPKTNYWPDWLK